MTPTKEITDVFKDAPTAPSLSGLFIMLANGLGQPLKGSADSYIVKSLYGANLDMDSLGSIPGVTFVRTTETTKNLPAGRTYGLLANATYSEPNVYQMFSPYTSAKGGIYTRCKNNGTWTAWIQLI